MSKTYLALVALAEQYPQTGRECTTGGGEWEGSGFETPGCTFDERPGTEDLEEGLR